MNQEAKPNEGDADDESRVSQFISKCSTSEVDMAEAENFLP